MKNNMRFITFLAAILTLNGCAGQFLTSKEPQSKIYSLRSIDATTSLPNTSARVLEIAPPYVPPGMDRNRIALYMNSGQTLDYYAGALWSSDLDEIIQDFTRRTASHVLPYIVAITPDQDIDADYRLQVRVNEFQPVYESDFRTSLILKVSVEFTLIELPSQNIVSSFTLYKQETLGLNTLDDIVSGLEKFLQDIERDAFIKMDAKLKANRRS